MFFEMHNDFVQEKEILAVGLSANECLTLRGDQALVGRLQKQRKKVYDYVIRISLISFFE